MLGPIAVTVAHTPEESLVGPLADGRDAGAELPGHGAGGQESTIGQALR